MVSSESLRIAPSLLDTISHAEPLSDGLAIYKRPSLSTPTVDAVTTSHVPAPKQKTTSAGALTTANFQPLPTPLFSPPKLKHPSRVTYSECALIHTLDELHASGESLITSFTTSLSLGSEKLKKLSLENIEKLKEAAQNAQSSEFWSFLQKIGECILAAISTVLGITLVATGAGAVIGGVMIAAGILTLTNFAMRETGTWVSVAKLLSDDKETQNNIAFYMPLGVGLVAAVLGIGGSVATALYTALNVAGQAITVLQASAGIYHGVTTVGKGVSEGQVLWTEADLTKIATETTLTRVKFERNSSLMRQTVKILESIQQSAEQVIDLSTQALKKSRIQA
ncbi:MAG: hypothetical protein NTX49_00170 [Chlamydiae bacterium]|nr:hypothetical protein [Chlamydiota bacterium]